MTSKDVIDKTSPRGLESLTNLTGVLMATIRSSGETHTPN